MKCPTPTVSQSLLMVSAGLLLFTAGCASEQKKNEKALRKQPGTTAWYEARERKTVTKVKDKREPKEMGYNRGQKAGWNPGTGLTVPKPDKTEKKKL